MRRTPIVMLTLILMAAGPALSGQSESKGRLVVLNKEDATLVVMDPGSGRILGRVATGEGPHEVAVSPDGRTAFVGNYGAQTPGGSISVIDLSTMKETRRVELGPLRRPHGIFFADGKVYFTAETNRLVARLDPASAQVDWMMGTGQASTHMVWVNPEATRIYTANIGSHSITIMERGNNPQAWNVTSVPVGRGPEGFDITPDGRELWTAHSQDGGVSIVNLAEKKVTGTIDAQTRRSNRLKFTPDGRLALISDLDSGDLIVIDVAAKKIAKRVPLGRMVEGILVQPDGARAYVAVTGDNQIAIVDLETLSVTSRIEPGKGPDGMAWIK